MTIKYEPGLVRDIALDHLLLEIEQEEDKVRVYERRLEAARNRVRRRREELEHYQKTGELPKRKRFHEDLQSTKSFFLNNRVPKEKA